MNIDPVSTAVAQDVNNINAESQTTGKINEKR
jgi:hypothetical protein